MPERQRLVINTTPLLSLIAATGNLEILRHLYREVCVPQEVEREIGAGQGPRAFGQAEFRADDFLTRETQPRQIAPLLRQSLDLGEASVIQLAHDRDIPLVAIDETAGRRVARLHRHSHQSQADRLRGGCGARGAADAGARHLAQR